MNMWSNLKTGLLALFQRKRVDAELEEELDTYMEASAEHKERAGLSPTQARRAAKIEIGSRNAVKQQVWASRWESAVDNLWQDVRLSLRMLTKSPGFTLMALLSLALGIGANTAIFTLIHQVLLRNMPVERPEQLVVFGQSTGAGINGGIDLGFNDLVTWDFARQLEARPGPFQGVAAYSSFAPSISIHGSDAGAQSAGAAGQAQQFSASMVSDNYFNVLGATPLLGRTFVPSEVEKPGSSAVVVLSYHYWQQELSADPDVLGKSISINRAPFRVIGVTRPGFHSIKPDSHPPDVYVPITMESQILLQPPFLEPRGVLFLHLFARRGEASLAAGANGLKQDQLWLDQQVRDYIRAGEGATISADRQQEINRAEPMKLLPGGRGVLSLGAYYGDALRILMGVVVLVLLIACANLANFLLARAAARQREIATRLALGSSRLRIVRQCLVETLLLSLTGGAVGLALAFAATRTLIAFVTQGAEFSGLSAVPDLSVLLFTLGVSIATGLLFGMGPAISTARSAQAGTSQSLGAGSRSATASRPTRLFPKFLVTAQVMLSLLLLIGAGLFLRTLKNLQSQDFGFERTRMLIAEFNPGLGGYTPDRFPALNRTILERLEAMPGVRYASISETAPISGGNWASSIKLSGYTPQPKENMISVLNRVSGHYFETTGIAIVAGRPIGPQDSASSLKVAVVNQSLANRYYPKGDAIGHMLTIEIDSVAGPWQIVGISRDTKSGAPRESKPVSMIYLPLFQLTGNDASASVIEVRTDARPENSIADLRRTLAAIDPNLPVFRISSITEQVDRMMSQERLFSSLTALFAGLAVLLAAIGLYGVMSYNVVRRTSEIGIRLALGAQTNSLLWMVLSESLLLLLLGLGLGLPLTLLSTRLIQRQLYGLSPLDPVTFAAAIVIVAAMTVLAAWLPARRATKVDPMVALRCD